MRAQPPFDLLLADAAQVQVQVGVRPEGRERVWRRAALPALLRAPTVTARRMRVLQAQARLPALSEVRAVQRGMVRPLCPGPIRAH